jgi:hypothetical protein
VASFECDEIYPWSVEPKAEPEHCDEEGSDDDEPASVDRRAGCRADERGITRALRRAGGLHGREIELSACALLAEIGRDPPTESDFSYPASLPVLNLQA